MTTPTRIMGLSGNLAFGNVEIGQSATKTLTITNTGDSTLTVSGLAVPTGTAYTASWTSGTIGAGGSQSVTITFAPTALRTDSGSLTVTADQTSGTNTIAISGVGVAASTTPSTPTRTISLSGDLAFGNVQTGQPASATMTISNSGNSTLTITGTTYPAGFSGNYSSGTISPGASQLVTVIFVPTAVQSYGGTITVTGDQTSGTNVIAVSGTGTTAPTPPPTPTRVIGLSGNLAFGSVAVGSTATATLTISNSGNALLTWSGISTGTSAVTATPTSGTVAAGGTQAVTLTFAPTAAQAYSGTVTVTGDQTSGTNTIAVSGTGTTAPTNQTRILGVSGNLVLGNVGVGELAWSTVTISNSGNSTLHISEFRYSDTVFHGDAVRDIPAGGSWPFSFNIVPTEAKSYLGTVTIVSDATSGGNTFTISATGVAPTRVIGVSPATLDLGSAVVGALSAAKDLTVLNTGSGTLTVSSVTTDNPAFVFTTATSFTVAPGKSVAVGIRFSPTAAVLHSAKVTIVSDAMSGQNTAAVIGTGVAPTRIIDAYLWSGGRFGFRANCIPGLSPSSIPNLYQQVIVGTTNSSGTLRIWNSGSTDLTITGNTSSNPDWAIRFYAAPPFVVKAGSALEWGIVDFSPKTLGNSPVTLTLQSDATSGNASFDCTGTAIAPTRVIELAGSLSFGQVNVGTTASATFTIKNTGNSTLTYSAINSSNPAFSVLSSSSGSLGLYESVTVVVRFTPTAAQSYSGMLTVISDATSGTSTISVSGTGSASTSDLMWTPRDLASLLTVLLHSGSR